MHAVELKTDFMTDPMGIGSACPVLTWKFCSGGFQKAFQVTAFDESGDLIADSGMVDSEEMRWVWHGRELSTGERVSWRVTVRDENGIEEDSKPAFFEMGILDRADWAAKWICGTGTDTPERLPADCYRKDFRLKRSVAKARIYATALGIYEARINGKRVDGFVLAPGCTEYGKRLYYQTYDVTKMLEPEQSNILEFTVGDGWYKGKLGTDAEECFFGQQTKLFAQLVINYSDGSSDMIATDESFKWSNDGPVRYNDLKDGVVYDARMSPSYSGYAAECNENILPEASVGPRILEHEILKPKLLISPGGSKILDFGENIAGYVRFRVRGVAGDVLKLSMCEVLDHGEYTDATFVTLPERGKSLNQAIRFTMSGREDVYEPNFFFAGFRYALVEGVDEIDPDDFSAITVYSDMEMTGSFSCSDPMITQFARNTVRSMKSNFIDIPMDCPTRERAGWTGDAQIFAKTSTYFADTAAFFRKWLLDVRDCQGDDGKVSNICPRVRISLMTDMLNGSVGWADAAVIIPWTMWKVYGSDIFITENLDLMTGWADYVIAAAGDKSMYDPDDAGPMSDFYRSRRLPDSPWNRYIIEKGFHFGEWSEPLDVTNGIDLTQSMSMPKNEEACAYTYYSMKLLAEMMSAVGRQKKAEEYSEFSEGAKKAYNFHFVKEGDIPTDRQAKLVRPLALGLLDERAAVNVSARLNRSAVERGYKVGTGFLSTPLILKVLADNGYVDTAYKMLENTKSPGWMAMVCQGATSVWENYNGFDEYGHPRKASMNHFSLGAVCEFLFSHCAGINVDGINHFRICPVPGGSLTWAETSYNSVYGRITSRWRRNENGYDFEIIVPPNCTAEIEFPDGEKINVGPGIYHS